jgi:hypothetical protein
MEVQSMTLISRAYANAPESAQASLSAIYRAAVKFLRSIGASAPIQDLVVGSDSDETNAALESFDAASAIVNGPTINILLGNPRIQRPASWDAVAQLYRTAHSDVRSAVRELRTSYERAGELSLYGQTLRSGTLRAYLMTRGASVPRSAPPNNTPAPPNNTPAPPNNTSEPFTDTRPVAMGIDDNVGGLILFVAGVWLVGTTVRYVGGPIARGAARKKF